MASRVKLSVFISIVVLVWASCARVGSPTGGDKDKTPPKVRTAQPANRSTMFAGKSIDIKFDEYIQLKDLNQQLIVSPPMDEKPEVKIRGKHLIIKLETEPKANTTYSIKLGNAVQDLNEGNPLNNFEYVFSTGATIDSLRLLGTVVSAYDFEPQKGVLVMAYRNYTDSTPLQRIPDFVARTDDKGFFSITNVPLAKYRVFALKDGNNNYLFDQPTEEIAFLEQEFQTKAQRKQYRDTIKLDSLRKIKPEAKQDSIRQYDSVIYTPDNLQLRMFLENRLIQFLSKRERPEQGRLFFVFNNPTDGKMRVRPLNFKADKNWYTLEKSANKDSVTCWINDSLVYKQDTLRLLVDYNRLDTLKKVTLFTDTVELIYNEPELPISIFGSGNEVVKPVLSVYTSVMQGGLHDINRNIRISTAHPTNMAMLSYVQLFELKDSVPKPTKFTVEKDTNFLRGYEVNFKPKENQDYRLQIGKGAFTDIFGVSNDTIIVDFKTKKKSDYATVVLALKGIKQAAILEVLNEQDQAIWDKEVDKNQKIEIPYLNPTEKYRLRVILDQNKDKKWTTGNYLKNKQPEKVFFFKGEIKLKANWDTEIEWEVEK